MKSRIGSSIMGALGLLLVLAIVTPAAQAGHEFIYYPELEWGSDGTGDGQFLWPNMVAVDASGDVYVTDANNPRVQKFDSDGSFITKWGSVGTGDAQFGSTEGIAVNGSGDVFVVDGNDRIQKFDSSGNFISKWGSEGSDDGQFQDPTGIAVDGSGDVYVADDGNFRIQKFDSGGNYIAKWGSYGVGNGEFSWISGIATDVTGDVYVAGRGNNRIQKFDSNGTYLNQFGSFPGVFHPNGVAVDGSGDVYVADTLNDRVSKFDSGGNYLSRIDKSSSAGGLLDGPLGVGVDEYGGVYVADGENDRIKKFVPVIPEVLVWPRSNELPFGHWTKLAGTVKGLNGAPISGDFVRLEYWDGSKWKWFQNAQTGTTGYYQRWFYNETGTRSYRARHDKTDSFSNTTSVALTENISAWNNYRPIAKYCQWSKIHGKYGGSDGPHSNATLFLQKWNVAWWRWDWLATVKTDSTGYYTAWMQVCPDTKVRMGTWGSVVTSPAVTKMGSRIIAWDNSRIHAALRDGWGNAVPGANLYLQKYDGSWGWTWLATCTTSSTGYCNFGSTNTSGWHVRIATEGSKVISSWWKIYP